MHDYEAVIGLECHAQLLTESKLFCSCSTKFGEAPNANTCPVCLCLPGALPVLNRMAVTMAVKAAVGLNCDIRPESQWARKNYFYPDLPKGYQISQYDRPSANQGFIEIKIEVVEGGGRVVQETRLWNSVEERTVSMRSKEEAHDYRYFPDPDLPLLTVDREWIKTVQQSMPELPESRRQRFITEYALSEYDAGVLTATRALADFFEDVTKLSSQPKTAANWIMGDLLRFLKDNNVDLKDLSNSPVSPKMLAGMISLVEKGTISGKIAKTVMEEMYNSGKDPQQIIEEKGLIQISNTDEIEKIVNKVIEENPKPVEQYRLGKTGNFGFFVGQVMKATGGRANPQTVNELLKKKLAG